MRRGLALSVCLSLLAFTPVAGAEQAGSKAKRVPSASLDAGADQTCVVLSTGQVRCWGENDSGRLGYGNQTDIGDTELPSAAGPVNLGVGRKATALGAGNYHTCAILDTGVVRCWGYGANGQLGYGNTSTIGDNETPNLAGPVKLGAKRTAVAITGGGYFTCAILDTGAVRCWGYGASGRLGLGNTENVGDNETPDQVATVNLGGGRTATALASGFGHTCAILDNGAVRCWGYGFDGALGYGNPDAIGDSEAPGSVPAVKLGAGRTAVAITAGDQHTCVILDNGAVRCWGAGTLGQLGTGSTAAIGDSETPDTIPTVNLGAGRTAVAIAAGSVHTCAILDNGSVRCWGLASDGQLGYGATENIGDTETPDTVGPVNLGVGRTAVAITAGGAHTCVLLDNETVRCWGLGSAGRLGYGNTDSIGDNETADAVGTLDLGSALMTRPKPGVVISLKPARDKKAPFAVTVSGRLTGFVSDRVTCGGKVKVRAKKGARAVQKTVSVKRVGASCTYSAKLTVKFKGAWKVTATFVGTIMLKGPSLSKTKGFRAG